MKLLLVLVAICMSAASVDVKARYDGYQVWSLILETKEHIEVMQTIDQNLEGYIFLKDLEGVLGQQLEIVVPPHKLADFQEFVLRFEMKSKLMTENLQNLIDNERPSVKPKSFGWTDYYSLADIYTWLDEITTSFAPATQPLNIGTSFEGRPLKGVKISYKQGNPAIIIETNIHAREWITSASTTWIINELLTSQDPRIRDIAENIDWYILPMVNPDGFEYTHNTNRLWRKTRQTFNGTTCIGTDGNRNFGYSWMMGGSSENPCSDTYAGPEALSEPEMTAIDKFLASVASQVQIYLSFHSYGQYLMYPFGHTQDSMDNEQEHIQIGTAAVNALESISGTPYTFGNAQTVLYTTSGGSRDHAKGQYNVPFSFTYEMRDTGRYGFQLPTDQIIPNASEILQSLIAMIGEARQIGYFSTQKQ